MTSKGAERRKNCPCAIDGLKLEPKFQYTINNKTVGEYYHIKKCCCIHNIQFSSAWCAWFFGLIFFVFIVVVFY